MDVYLLKGTVLKCCQDSLYNIVFVEAGTGKLKLQLIEITCSLNLAENCDISAWIFMLYTFDFYAIVKERNTRKLLSKITKLTYYVLF